MRSLAFPLAVLLAAAALPLAVAALVAAARWGRWLVTAGGAVGVLGLVLTAGAVVNLGVPRTCDGEDGSQVNRTLLVLGDGDCFRSSALQVGAAALVGVAASAATTVRRSRRGGAGAVPVAPLP